MIAATWAVVVNWNGGEANRACVRSLLAEGLVPERIVFVDNGSTDGSLEQVVADVPGLVTLCNQTNEGYGHATNRGVRHALEAGAEAVFCVNNDVSFDAGEETLARLCAELEAHASVGVCGPRVVYAREPERIWAAGGRMTYRQNLSDLIGHREPDGPRFRTTTDVDYVPGCAMLVRREVFERAGFLDGSYFAYHEDVEFCMNVRAAGYLVRLVGEVRALHDAHHSTGGGYSPARKYMMGVNTVRFLKRHGTPARWLSFLVFDVATLPVAGVVRGLSGNGRGVWAKAVGTFDGLRGRAVTSEAIQRFVRG